MLSDLVELASFMLAAVAVAGLTGNRYAGLLVAAVLLYVVAQGIGNAPLVPRTLTRLAAKLRPHRRRRRRVEDDA